MSESFDIRRLVATEPVFCFTSDQDWASAFAVEHLVGRLAGEDIVPALFVTHECATAQKFAASGKIELGIHPNFLRGSSHGTAIADVLDHVMRLVPRPLAMRCHSYSENSHIMAAAAQRGIRHDSNTCLFLQPGLQPVRHWTGIVRHPVFWEDDIHWACGLGWRRSDLPEVFFSPGLKILDIHPFFFACNIPDQDHYSRVKSAIQNLDAPGVTALRYPGDGCGTFVELLLETIRRRRGRIARLSEVCRAFDDLRHLNRG